MEGREKNSMNNSASKFQFSFSKSSRFSSKPGTCSQAFYDIKGYFGLLKGTNAGRGFSSSSKRFHGPRMQTSFKIDGPGLLDSKGNAFTRTQKYTFGVSRSCMNKLYVDRIMKDKENSPGPQKYDVKTCFGASPGYSI